MTFSYKDLLLLFAGDNSGWADIFDRTIKKAEPQDLPNDCCMCPCLDLISSVKDRNTLISINDVILRLIQKV